MTTLWFLLIGVLLVAMTLLSTFIERLPVSTALLYLVVGFCLGPKVLGWLALDPLARSHLFEVVAEIVVLVSLFAVGLKLRLPLGNAAWRDPVRLATVSMVMTAGLLTLVGVFALALPLGAAILLGAILSPTDPVLASDVQLREPGDRDRLRFDLTAEGGLNDGTAFPFVMLGLLLLEPTSPGAASLARWFAVDVVWAVAAGLASGFAWGHGLGRAVVHLRTRYQVALRLDEFVLLGLIALSYGFALLIHAYGFLAVFAAGLALRQVERRASEAGTQGEAPLRMTETLLGFNEQLERIAEVGVVLVVGTMLATIGSSWHVVWLAPVLFLVIRPIAVGIGLPRGTAGVRRALIAWFGVRGIGSLYYVLYATNHGIATPLADTLVELVLGVIAASIVVHGISATPLMALYSKRRVRRAGKIKPEEI